MSSVPIKLNVAESTDRLDSWAASAGAYFSYPITARWRTRWQGLGRVSQWRILFPERIYAGELPEDLFSSRHVHDIFAPTTISIFDFRRLITCNLRWFARVVSTFNTLTFGSVGEYRFLVLVRVRTAILRNG